MAMRGQPRYNFGDEGRYGDSLGNDGFQDADFTNPSNWTQPTNTTPSSNMPSTGGGYTPGSSFGSGSGSGSYNPGNGYKGDTSWMKNVFDQATSGTLNSYNNSANRLRERLDSSSQGQMKSLTDSNIGRGFGNSGVQERAVYNTNAANQDAYANGLNQLSTQFEQMRQQGLQTALGAGKGIADNELGWGKLGSDDYNSQMQRELQKYLGDQDNKTNLTLGKLSSGNQSLMAWLQSVMGGKGV